MGKKEAGRFRGQLFGGFRRRDVLEYMGVLYGRIDQADLEKEAMRARCEELENLLQNLEKFSGQRASTLAGTEFSARPKEESSLEMDPELVALLNNDPAPESVEEVRAEVEVLEAVPEAPQEEVMEAEPVVPESAPEVSPVPEPVVPVSATEAAPVAPTPELVPEAPVAAPVEEPKSAPEPAPPSTPPTLPAKPGRTMPYPPPSGGQKPKRVKVHRK